jgi:hypothetical protein
MGPASGLDHRPPLAHDPGFLDRSDQTGPTIDVIEVRRMLTAFIEKRTADG